MLHDHYGISVIGQCEEFPDICQTNDIAVHEECPTVVLQERNAETRDGELGGHWRLRDGAEQFAVAALDRAGEDMAEAL